MFLLTDAIWKDQIQEHHVRYIGKTLGMVTRWDAVLLIWEYFQGERIENRNPHVNDGQEKIFYP